MTKLAGIKWIKELEGGLKIPNQLHAQLYWVVIQARMMLKVSSQFFNLKVVPPEKPN